VATPSLQLVRETCARATKLPFRHGFFLQDRGDARISPWQLSGGREDRKEVCDDRAGLRSFNCITSSPRSSSGSEFESNGGGCAWGCSTSGWFSPGGAETRVWCFIDENPVGGGSIYRAFGPMTCGARILPRSIAGFEQGFDSILIWLGKNFLRFVRTHREIGDRGHD
jgi:hypothetical protein